MNAGSAGRRRAMVAGLSLAVVVGGAAVALGAGSHYNEVEQTVHNILPPSGYTLKERCLACHVDGKISLPGMAISKDDAVLPAFGDAREQRPVWEQGAPVKNFSLPQSWPLPPNMSPDRPFGVSADCLGCHDGTVAEDVQRGHERMGIQGATPLSNFFDQLEVKLGANPSRKGEIPDHPIATFYPRKPNGEQSATSTVSSQRRFFAIPDLQDDQLILPDSTSASKYYAETPGNPQPVLPNDTGPAAVAQPASASGGEAATDITERYRLIHTTFGVIHCDSCHNAHSELHAGFLRDKSPQLCLVCHDR